MIETRCLKNVVIFIQTICKIVVIIVKNNKKLKNYLHRESYTLCGEMTHKENLEQSQNHFF